MSEHTPGPWTWGEYFQGLYGSGPNNEVLEFIPYGNMFLGYNRKEANARLIAAAPDLLEALQRVLSTVEHMYHISPDPDGSLWQDVLVCRTAITKATGQS